MKSDTVLPFAVARQEPAISLEFAPQPRSAEPNQVLATAQAPVSASSVHLDAIRAIAAIVVVLGHARQMFLMSPTKAVLGLNDITRGLHGVATQSSWGHQAVIVFFVLSGFLVGGSVVRDIRLHRWSWSRYLLNRMTRLWVVLIPALLLGWCLDSYGLTHFAGQSTIYDGPPGQIQIIPNLSGRLTPEVAIGNLLFLQTIRVSTLGTNTALWSLANEFWYYIAFPFLALALWGSGTLWTRLSYASIFAAILLLAGPSIGLYLLVWLVGVAAVFVPCVIPKRLRQPTAIIATVLFVALNVWLRSTSLKIEVSDGILAVAFFGLLYCVLHLRQPAQSNFYKQGAQFLSRISYTFYLTHLPALALACALLNRPWHRWSTTPAHLFQFSLVLGCVSAYSVLVFYCFEAHTDAVRRRINRVFKPPAVMAVPALSVRT
jgi:peptidoglycan/LPS O-acetylase OafA/YrhL